MKIPEGHPELVWHAFQLVVHAWRRERKGVRLSERYGTTDTGFALPPLEPGTLPGTLPRTMACCLALATTLHEFVVHDPAALAKVAAFVDREQAASRRRRRRSTVSDAGAKLVQIAEVVQLHEVVDRLASAVRALPELGYRSLPNREALAKAKNAADAAHWRYRDETPRRRAQAIVQYVLTAFGMSRDAAKNAAGLRKK